MLASPEWFADAELMQPEHGRSRAIKSLMPSMGLLGHHLFCKSRKSLLNVISAGPTTQFELILGRRRLSRSNGRKRGPNHGNCALRVVKWQFAWKAAP